MVVISYLRKRFQKDPDKYQFRHPKDGYLIYRRNLSSNVRGYGEKLLSFLNYVNNKIEDNKSTNKLILESLELPPDSKINELDAFHKREFRKKKYIQRIINKPTKQLPEPKEVYEYVLLSDAKIQTKSSSSEFLKSFRAKRDK